MSDFISDYLMILFFFCLFCFSSVLDTAVKPFLVNILRGIVERHL